jgi:hypothetical protein
MGGTGNVLVGQLGALLVAPKTVPLKYSCPGGLLHVVSAMEVLDMSDWVFVGSA